MALVERNTYMGCAAYNKTQCLHAFPCCTWEESMCANSSRPMFAHENPKCDREAWLVAPAAGFALVAGVTAATILLILLVTSVSEQRGYHHLVRCTEILRRSVVQPCGVV